MSDVRLGTRPRYCLAVDEVIKKPTKQTNSFCTHSQLTLFVILFERFCLTVFQILCVYLFLIILLSANLCYSSFICLSVCQSCLTVSICLYFTLSLLSISLSNLIVSLHNHHKITLLNQKKKVRNLSH